MSLTPASIVRRSPADLHRLAEISRVATIDQPAAWAMAVSAGADGLSDPLIHHLIGLNHKNEGRFAEAVVEIGLGLELDPQNPKLAITLGFCLLELGRRQEAAKVFELAMKLDPRSAEASYGYGWAAERLGALESAQSGFSRAVALNPNHADALAGLSGLAARRRDWDAAKSFAERAAKLDPRQTDALMNLARVEIGRGRFRPAAQRLLRIIKMPHLKPLARANAKIMQGDALDGAGLYSEAFKAYSQGKTELRALYASTYEALGEPTAVDGVREILDEFLDTPEASWRGSPLGVRGGERGHAFLLGFPRSGTTLLEQIIETHPSMVALGERPVMVDAETEFLTQAGGVKRLADVVSSLLEPYRNQYWNRVREFGVNPDARVFVDKHPLNTIRLPLIAKIFPNSKIIFAYRDPRDVVLSCFRRSFNMNASMYEFNTIVGAARLYDAVMTAGEIYFERLSFDVHRIRHEDIVSDFEATGRLLCEFLDVQWTDQLKDFAQTANNSRIATPSSVQVGRGLSAEGVGHWRNYRFALEEVMPILEPWIKKFGYSAD